MKLYEVEITATVYVLAESGDDAEDIACSQVERDWLTGWASERAVEADRIDSAWRDVVPLVAYGETVNETCQEIAEREARERTRAAEAARQVALPGVKP